jgi:succinate dehydrogenase / fumarate reductase, cytochrome b subunit
MYNQRPAPVFLDLFRIRFPAGAITSIAHRAAGVLLFLALPFLVYLLDLSLQGPEGFARAGTLLQSWWVRPVSVVLVWSLLHHLLAGVRFLLIDVDVGAHLQAARTSARVVNILGIALALAYAGWIV